MTNRLERSRRAFIKRVVGAGTAAVMAGPMSGGMMSSRRSAGITGFDHIAVPMRSTDAIVAFYRTLGFQVNEGDEVCSVHVGDHTIDFHRPGLWQRKTFSLRASGASPPCGDFCFVWDGGLTSLQAMLDNAGAKVIKGPVEHRGGRDGGRKKGTSLYVRDPDQNLLEFIVYPNRPYT